MAPSQESTSTACSSESEAHQVNVFLPEGTVVLESLEAFAALPCFPEAGELWRVLAADASIDLKEVVYRRYLGGEAIGVPVVDLRGGEPYGYSIFHRSCYSRCIPHVWQECCRVHFDDVGFRIEEHPEWDCIPASGPAGVVAVVIGGTIPTPWMHLTPLPLGTHGGYCEKAISAEHEEQRKAAKASRDSENMDVESIASEAGGAS